MCDNDIVLYCVVGSVDVLLMENINAVHSTPKTTDEPNSEYMSSSWRRQTYCLKWLWELGQGLYVQLMECVLLKCN